MSAESPRGPNIRELESLRIARAPEAKRPGRLLPAAIALVVLAVIGAAGYLIYQRTLGRPIEVQTAIVTMKQAGQAGTLLTGSGYIITEHKYTVIGTKILGQIIAEPIEEGQKVKRGDLLARIDDRDYQAQLRQAYADRDLAMANVKLKHQRAKRVRELYKEGVQSKDALDDAENQLSVAEAALKRADGAIDYAKFNVSQTVIRSPINGVVLRKYREVGDTINFGGTIQAGGGTTDIAQLADLSDLRCEVDINESDISKVVMGAPATVIPDAYPDNPFAGKVVKIYPQADRQKGTVKIEVRILQPDLKIIKPEMSAKVTFLSSAPTTKVETAPTVLAPKKAIVTEGNSNSVWVIRDGIAHSIPVTLGREYQEGVEVKQGLNGGEMVIVVPPAQLRNGEAVTPASS
ncbi:MAG: efflux RND transporter periplasmic adaptor subunit [Candidatus Binatus sp.]|uniref:efflux RND transporter periplasmic adaptor subunit n=1 Tax=Candidatus Binatus sp. TaxID=2811406 RepID=UPI00272748D1|nr:efflux RND transporter periplasmic adaptor subunit [Candidatus Binatus sp.]MDO8434853.1 efflux RND transporter periplasmic adaptor subunit [Candidatus Binatus sp.]